MASGHAIQVERIVDAPNAGDWRRVAVDRLSSRGVSRRDAVRIRYRAELDARAQCVGAREARRDNVVALRDNRWSRHRGTHA